MDSGRLGQVMEDKQKVLRMHIQGILRSNALAHKHVADAANHLADALKFLSTPVIVVLAQSTSWPLIGVHLPLMDTFLEEAKKRHEEMVQQRNLEKRPIHKIYIEQNLPRLSREWEYQHEGEVNSRLAALVTRYMHEALMRDKKQFYSGTALATMFKVRSSTLNKLISGRKYMGGAELEKYMEEMKHKGVEIK